MKLLVIGSGGRDYSFRCTSRRQGISKVIWIAMVLGFVSVGTALQAAAASAKPLCLVSGSNAIEFTADGGVVGWFHNAYSGPPGALASAGQLRYGSVVLDLTNPFATSTRRGVAAFRYRWSDVPGLEVELEHRLERRGGAVAWVRDMRIRSRNKLSADLTVSLPVCSERLPKQTWLPLVNGVGAALGTNRAAAYRFAGALPGEGAPLAIPMVSFIEPAGAKRVTIATDVYFSSLFYGNAVTWSYPARVGLANNSEERTIAVIRHIGSPDAAVTEFFDTILRDVHPGPAWLHNVAMVDYDYLSDGGQGWFRDLDALTTALPKTDRRKVFLCLHGWYDFLGRYCFDTKTGKLDREWTAFSNYEHVKNSASTMNIEGDQVLISFANCKPVKLTLAEIHRRLRYARSRGFRAGVYFADGMNAGEGLSDFSTNRVLQWGGWQGPDSKGKSYLQNPLCPEVRAFFLHYASALLAEFGPDLDALVWDETFHIPPGSLGSDAFPGYADRAMMRLTRDLTKEVEHYNRNHRRQIAFLTSDCLGAFGKQQKAPYALVAHGTYQDSWCKPEAWSYGVFANYRNVLWSCCWWPVTKWRWIEFGVREYQAPVAISNGWGDDKGFAELTDVQRVKVLALFNWRKQTATRLKWFSDLPVYTSSRN
jgi:hypothetical protein